ncbi:glycosyl transferase family 25 [Bisgaardia hudsonensis]|uniref:Glycosyl transferase family 25 n=1 Tax=Bisgaardia hudsonensis TaxID=109472 RepID=A0A4R2MYM1_9PAST|nr:glycosyltransferase family 25 protein [Bisgaardia hudsonensis]TCP11728.1 glycosyl transferase family 25 [Bisgaardia hudsonensis]
MKQFSEKNIPFHFFNAIVPDDKLIDNLLPNLKNTSLTVGEKGCLLSHLVLWKKCIDDNLPYIIIFEDDVLLGKDADLFLCDDSWLTERFNFNENIIIRLETFLMPVKLDESSLSSYLQRTFPILKSVHFGTAGYIITHKAAKYLLEVISSLSGDNLKAIDRIIFDSMVSISDFQVYQLSPAICIQELQLNQSNSKLISQIETERRKIWLDSKPKRNFLQKIFREIYRIKRRKQQASYKTIYFE